jgi:hypothetical protein
VGPFDSIRSIFSATDVAHSRGSAAPLTINAGPIRKYYNGPAEAFGSSLKGDVGPLDTLRSTFSATDVAHSRGSAAPLTINDGPIREHRMSIVGTSVGPYKTRNHIFECDTYGPAEAFRQLSQ